MNRKFGRKKDQRKALLKGLAVNLFLRGKIKTTEAKAKEMRGLVERLIQKTKKGDLAGIRYAAKFLPKMVVKKLVKDIVPKYLDRQGGYTRIIRIGQRKNDAAETAIIELI